MTRFALSATLCLVLAPPAYAINKCTGTDGKIVLQDAQCMGKGETFTARPAIGQAPTPAVAEPAASAPTFIAKKERIYGAKWRRRTDLELHLIHNARRDLSEHLQQCRQQQAALAARRGEAKPPQSRAAWDASIASEMQVAASSCETKTREFHAVLEGYERELRELQPK